MTRTSLNQSKQGALERLLHKASNGYTAIVRHINNIFKVGKLIRFQLVQKRYRFDVKAKIKSLLIFVIQILVYFSFIQYICVFIGNEHANILNKQ
jgi:hypothetical protein